MPDIHQPPSSPDDPDTVEPTAGDVVDPVVDDESGEELGELAGGGEVTDLAGDGISS